MRFGSAARFCCTARKKKGKTILNREEEDEGSACENQRKNAKEAIESAPYNAKYISFLIQKEIIHILSTKVRDYIREEIRDFKYCIMVDEARDESKKEQMAIILRFVDKYGLIKERFFDPIHVVDTSTSTLKKEVCSVLSRHNLNVENIHGQGYGGASNMRGLNQIGTLKRVGDTRWSSHLPSIRSLITMFNSSNSVLENISFDKTCKFSQRGDADAALNLLIFYDFVFIVHLMIKILQNANTLCQALQQKSQNIVSALKLVSIIKRVLQTYREDVWHTFIEKVKLFCEQYDILIPNMDALMRLVKVEHDTKRTKSQLDITIVLRYSMLP
ncbi:uncharacterized protein LOC130809329 [Amaranthus tricolor]|uniref:uncharacterized protein LOC130809329 n=1 Tax=Amaranthus tricolor TaxID=29722 RepID=UPI00258AF27D|nr:uncharacterized protein LOC130809329 [Amaranthus tricolor]